jgi:hypothetical protein
MPEMPAVQEVAGFQARRKKQKQNANHGNDVV